MADVTVKQLDEFDTAYGGAMKRVRAGLGVTSFGMQVFDLPPKLENYPEHDHSEDGQEEVYTVLEGEATLHRRTARSSSCAPACSRVSAPARSARSRPATSPLAYSRSVEARGRLRGAGVDERGRGGTRTRHRLAGRPSSADAVPDGSRHRRQGRARDGREQGDRTRDAPRRSRARARGSRSPAARASGSRQRRASSRPPPASTCAALSPTPPIRRRCRRSFARCGSRSARSRSWSPTPVGRRWGKRWRSIARPGRPPTVHSSSLRLRWSKRSCPPCASASGDGSSTSRPRRRVMPIAGLMLSNSHRLAAIGAFKTLANELGPDGILVNSVAPGSIATDRIAELRGVPVGGARRRGVAERPAGQARNHRGDGRRRRLPLLRAGLVRDRRQPAGGRRAVGAI